MTRDDDGDGTPTSSVEGDATTSDDRTTKVEPKKNNDPINDQGQVTMDDAKHKCPRCTVCSIALRAPTVTVPEDKQQLQSHTPKERQVNNVDSNNGNNNNDGNDYPSFVTLTCTGRCHVKNDDNTTSASRNNIHPYSYYCVPDCWEHFLQFQWGIYSGLGQAHQRFDQGLLGKACERCRSDLTVVHSNDDSNISSTITHNGLPSLSLEESLARVSPQVLAKALTILQQATVDKLKQQTQGDSTTDNNNNNKDEDSIIRRLTLDLEDQRLLQCPSCRFKIAIPENRGCDAAWCEHCGRALCLYCLTDCGDHPKTDPTAHHSHHLIGDAHEHVLNNDCGWTAGKGIIHSGKTLLRHHERQFRHKVALRLKRVPPPIRDAVCRNLQIEPESLLEHDHHHGGGKDGDNSQKHPNQQSLTKLRRQMENDKWEHYPQELRVAFLHAAYKGDVPLLQCLLEAGMPCHIPDAVGGETALHFAAVKGHVQVIQVLLEKGANPWQLSPPGRTPLDDLCNMESSCDLDAARCLIKACMLTGPAIDVDRKMVYPWLRPWPNGITALACAKEHHPDNPVSDYFVALPDSCYRLCKACSEGETDQVKLLLSNTTDQFPRPQETDELMKRLPPAQDLIWIYNQGSGCTPLLDLCAKSPKVSPQHVLASAKRILNAAKQVHDNDDTNRSNNHAIRSLLQMRDFKFHATALHWLALDVRPPILQVAGMFLQHAGNALSRAVDKRGQTPLDWARKFALNKDQKDENFSEERRRHIERWEAISLAWEEEA